MTDQFRKADILQETVAKRLAAIYGGTYELAPPKAFSDWDIQLILPYGPTLYFEVKEDLMAPKTGNVFVEYFSRRKALRHSRH